MKRAFKYRFYPTDAQAAELSRTFGCVRLVCNEALETRAGTCHCGVTHDRDVNAAKNILAARLAVAA